jgi:thiamine kinase
VKPGMVSLHATMTAPPDDSADAAIARLVPAPQPQWQALPGGRTNRLWRVGDLVVKRYDPDATSPLFPNDPKAEALALRLFAPHGLAPMMRASGSGWLIYDHVKGAVWSGDPAPVAKALYRLHQIDLPEASFRRLGSGSADLHAQACAMAGQCRGTLPPVPADPGLPPVALRPLHGDAVPGNIVVGPQSKITLIDWQCPALGDPAEDLATFLSPAMQWLYRGRPLSKAEEQVFLAAYPDTEAVARTRALAPLFHWRMAVHCLWKLERGASDYGPALRLELDAL